MSKALVSRLSRAQAGVAAVEFALVCAVFFTALLGVIEFGRLLWTWNAATEATRLGARLAVVCDMNDDTVRSEMEERLPVDALKDLKITVAYLNPPFAENTCTAATCKAVRVSLTAGYDMIIPFVPLTLDLPPFTTTLRREYMHSTDNPICS